MGMLFVLEIALILPLDAILMFFCLQNRRKIPLYIAIATLASTLSGSIGYCLGHFLWDCIGPFVLTHIIPAASFAKLSLHFQNYESLVVFFGAITPFPIKILSLASGLFHINYWVFLAYFLAARFVRFSLIGIAMILWGDKVKLFLDRHFHNVLLAIFAKMALVSSFVYFLSK
jgi:membrane protein YqaA with SNARE-associated domain